MLNLKEIQELASMENKEQLIKFKFEPEIDERFTAWLRLVNVLFSSTLLTNKPELIKYCPYEVRVNQLIEKNEWTTGHYTAVENDDGTLDLSLNFKKLFALDELPTNKMVWVLFHEFRHKIQLYDEQIKSVIEHSNWLNFKIYMMHKTGKDEDFINHIFHELNPAEVDAHIFACQMTGIKFTGTAFDITDEKLQLLK